MPTAAAYVRYTDWCDDAGVKMRMQRRSFTTKVKELYGFEIRTVREGQRTFRAFAEASQNA